MCSMSSYLILKSICCVQMKSPEIDALLTKYGGSETAVLMYFVSVWRSVVSSSPAAESTSAEAEIECESPSELLRLVRQSR